MPKLLITGGVLRPNGFELGEGKYYGCAKLLRLDTETGHVEELISISEGNENFPDEYPNLEFTVGYVDGKNLWLPTDTEIRLYSYPELKLQKTFSHPCFHNIHSVNVHENRLYVTSTGLDMVVVLDKDSGEILEYLNAEGKETWHRFSEDVDYRKVHSTRPHDSHPNFVFWNRGKPWVTRCTQEDAVDLTDVNSRIDISGPDKEISVHDGIVVGDKVYFTSVDGYIIIGDLNTHETLESINLNEFENYGPVRGWCRGLHVEGDTFYLGYSLLRKTRRLDKLKWLSKLVNRGSIREECSVLAVDLKKRKVLADYPISSESISAIYSILEEPK
ncbi:MAG: hypothetical protein OEX00_03830 [Gammaproteobacteria bacterium]|nr:hypothetical protein [Gammaproteobacteria bacterium]MDH5691598.1 hypothetical protein [Gammaproteobacteria bacterium]